MKVIQSLWIGDSISMLERLSMASYVYHGHEYNLFTYANVGSLPDGVIQKDANEILDESEVFFYQRGRARGSVAAFSNVFRYKLLSDRGGWWSDTDVVCLRPFDFVEDYVFASEIFSSRRQTVIRMKSGKVHVTTSVLRAPPGSPVFVSAWERSQVRDQASLKWGKIGPRLMESVIAEFNLQEYVQAHRTFCPVDYHDWESVLKPSISYDFDSEVFAVHFWNEMWRRNGVDKNARYHPDCLFERLKRTYACELPDQVGS